MICAKTWEFPHVGTSYISIMVTRYSQIYNRFLRIWLSAHSFSLLLLLLWCVIMNSSSESNCWPSVSSRRYSFTAAISLRRRRDRLVVMLEMDVRLRTQLTVHWRMKNRRLALWNGVGSRNFQKLRLFLDVVDVLHTGAHCGRSSNDS